MTARLRPWLAWSLCVVAVGLTPIAALLWAANVHIHDAFTPAIALAPGYALVGAIIASRTGKRIGWLLLAFAVIAALTGFTFEYAVRSAAQASPLPIGDYVAWVSNWLFPLSFPLLGLALMYFPDDRLPSRRWRFIPPVVFVAFAFLVLAAAFTPEPIKLAGNLRVPTPVGIWLLGKGHPLEFLSANSPIEFLILFLVGVGALILGASAPFVRYRRSGPEQRAQLRWFVWIESLSIVLAVVSAMLTGWSAVVGVTLGLLPLLGLCVGIPVAIGIGIFKYRLYDIDVVINKTLVYFSLAAFITAIYVGIVVGIGAAIGQGTSKPNLGLSILATGVVAVAFQPVRERVQKLANRLVYGRRATPYEVLSEFGHRMAGTYAADDVLPRMARILAEGTGAREARVWLASSGELTPVATWPLANGDGHGTRPDADLIVPVSHQGEELGALSISKAPGERLTPAEEKLTNDLASQAGLVLRNVKLIEDLKASRVRLVQAQDEERRKIERNIHDGAQQQLVALQVKLGLARRLAADPDQLDPILTQLQTETNQALQDLRDLARGIYPPLLQDKGMAAALESQARKAPIPVTVESDGIGRYPQDIEAAVYFCVLEALQNVAKYANALSATVTLSASDGLLSFEVADDGRGFDSASTSYGTGLQGMSDRLNALGGEVVVGSQPGSGTTVTGRVPVKALEPVE
jgi:signal transduction histidine kinase